MINCRHELVRANEFIHANHIAQTSLCLQIKKTTQINKHYCRYELVHAKSYCRHELVRANKFIRANHIAQTSLCLQIKKKGSTAKSIIVGTNLFVHTNLFVQIASHRQVCAYKLTGDYFLTLTPRLFILLSL